MMSQGTCFEVLPPDPSLVPEGQRKSESEHGNIQRDNKKDRGKKVRFKYEGAPPDPVEPSSSEEYVEFQIGEFQKEEIHRNAASSQILNLFIQNYKSASKLSIISFFDIFTIFYINLRKQYFIWEFSIQEIHGIIKIKTKIQKINLQTKK